MIANGTFNLSRSSQPPYFSNDVLIYNCDAGYAPSNPIDLVNECIPSSSSSSMWAKSANDLLDICQPCKCIHNAVH